MNQEQNASETQRSITDHFFNTTIRLFIFYLNVKNPPSNLYDH